MKYPIINLNGFLYAVDREVKLGPNDQFLFIEGSPKIIATNDTSLGLPLLPAIEENIEAEFNKWEESLPKELRQVMSDFAMEHTYPVRGALRVAFTKSYKAAKAKQYSAEDMRKAYREGFGYRYYANTVGSKVNTPYKSEDEFIQSLTPKLIAVELEMNGGELKGFVQNKNNPIVQAFSPHREPYTIKVDEKGFVIVKQWYYE